MIKSLKLDMKSMKAASPYWGQSFASQSPPLSYADTVGAGSNSSGSARVSKSVSFSDDTPSTQSSTRSVLKRANEQGIEGGAIVVDLQGSELVDTEQPAGNSPRYYKQLMASIKLTSKTSRCSTGRPPSQFV